MDSYQYKKFTTSRNFLYSFIHVKPTQAVLGYILFLHGFPSSSYDWRHQIKFFEQKGYGIIAPDLLGYGESSKPLEIMAYTGKGMAEDVAELLKHEDVSEVIGVAHDWGSFLLSRLVNYYPLLFTKLVFLDVGYVSPGHGLTEQTVQFVDAQIQQHMGFSCFGYFLFFNEEDAAELLDANIDSIQSLMYSNDNELGKKHMGARGATRTWVSSGQVANQPAWRSSQDIEHDRKLFSAQNGGYSAALNWYRSQLKDINAADEKEIPEGNTVLKQPTLFFTTNNFISSSGDFASQMKPFAPKLEVKKLDTGHWVQLEKPDEVNESMGEFFGR